MVGMLMTERKFVKEIKMDKNWYPMIGHARCVGDLYCVEFCSPAVFEEKSGKPAVVSNENCVEFYRGCQKVACESDVITYFGEEV